MWLEHKIQGWVAANGDGGGRAFYGPDDLEFYLEINETSFLHFKVQFYVQTLHVKLNEFLRTDNTYVTAN